MVAGRGVYIVRASHVTYGKGDTPLSIANIAFVHAALAITPGSTGGGAGCAIAPVARDCDIRHRVMVGVMHRDSHRSGPSTALARARSIQVTHVHSSSARGRRVSRGGSRAAPHAIGAARIGEALPGDRDELPVIAGRMEC